MAKKFSANHAFNQATQSDAESEALATEAQHRALAKMISGGANTASTANAMATPAVPALPSVGAATPPPAPMAALPSLPKMGAAATAPAMPGAAAKGQFFTGITCALRKPKIGL